MFILDVCESVDCGVGLCEPLPSGGYHCLCSNGTEQSYACSGDCGGVLTGNGDAHSWNLEIFCTMIWLHIIFCKKFLTEVPNTNFPDFHAFFILKIHDIVPDVDQHS